MVVRVLPKKPKKILLLWGICLLSSLALFSVSWHPSNEGTEEPLQAPGPDLRYLSRVGVLPGSAPACSTAPVPVLVAFVHSSPSHVPHREAIRTTWGSLRGMKTVFVVGRSENQKIWQRVKKEAQEHKDLVLLDIADTYTNLTLKHLAGIKWVLSNCPETSYTLKSDDDIFVDTVRLLSMLDSLLGTRSTDALVCHVIPEGSLPKRTGKWAVTREEYPHDQYPEYCSGQAYFTRTSALRKLSEAAVSGAVPYLAIDDVFVTGLLAKLAGVTRQDLGVRFADIEQSVIVWTKGQSLRPCPWMVTELSSYHWPKEAKMLWNKTVAAWKRLNHPQDVINQLKF